MTEQYCMEKNANDWGFYDNCMQIKGSRYTIRKQVVAYGFRIDFELAEFSEYSFGKWEDTTCEIMSHMN